MASAARIRYAIEKLNEAFVELQNLGWQQIMYAPQDGTEIEVIELGSIGIHVARHLKPGFWVADAGDLWPSRPILWRPLKKKDGVLR